MNNDKGILMNAVIPTPGGEDLWWLAKRCGAVYICPKDGARWLGPLVAYAGKDAKDRNFVGGIYFNFRKIESHLAVVEAFAKVVYKRLHILDAFHSFDTVCGIPHGGRTFGQAVAYETGKRFVYADKVPKPTEPGKKQEYTWDLSQFEFEPGERVAVAEDVFNNFQNTDHTLNKIAETGAKVVMLIGAFNRSPHYSSAYIPKKGFYAGQSLPIITSICEAFPEFQQDDPAVADDVARGNVEYNVKKNWARLVEAMGS